MTPALPAGLSLSTSTGIISGTPMAATATANYTVTASNTGGSTTATLTIAAAKVVPAEPAMACATVAQLLISQYADQQAELVSANSTPYPSPYQEVGGKCRSTAWFRDRESPHWSPCAGDGSVWQFDPHNPIRSKLWHFL